MGTVSDITGLLAGLSTEELQQIERSLISIYRQRKTGILYDDAHGVWTEENQAAAADQVFRLLDAEETRNKPDAAP
ncbi:MAG: hypothetical protein N3I86_14355 [Verrucomicrobiae bacterium]|nr:hypothetical protein [Verrucomicrobiae bacterium]MDW8309344.1 hypothetical protein [Verrucomicrobiales bacterium]